MNDFLVQIAQNVCRILKILFQASCGKLSRMTGMDPENAPEFIDRHAHAHGKRMHVHGLQDANPVLIQDPEFSNNGKKTFHVELYLLVHLSGKIAFHQNV